MPIALLQEAAARLMDRARRRYDPEGLPSATLKVGLQPDDVHRVDDVLALLASLPLITTPRDEKYTGPGLKIRAMHADLGCACSVKALYKLLRRLKKDGLITFARRSQDSESMWVLNLPEAIALQSRSPLSGMGMVEVAALRASAEARLLVVALRSYGVSAFDEEIGNYPDVWLTENSPTYNARPSIVLNRDTSLARRACGWGSSVPANMMVDLLDAIPAVAFKARAGVRHQHLHALLALGRRMLAGQVKDTDGMVRLMLEQLARDGFAYYHRDDPAVDNMWVKKFDWAAEVKLWRAGKE